MATFTFGPHISVTVKIDRCGLFGHRWLLDKGINAWTCTHCDEWIQTSQLHSFRYIPYPRQPRTRTFGRYYFSDTEGKLAPGSGDEIDHERIMEHRRSFVVHEPLICTSDHS